MAWTDVFAPIEAENRRVVMENTWGHLAPKRNKKYKGNIIFAVGCYGSDYLNPTVLQCNLKDLPDSPFFYDAIQEFLQKDHYEAGCVYEFVGFFRNYVFDGTIRKMELK